MAHLKGGGPDGQEDSVQGYGGYRDIDRASEKYVGKSAAFDLERFLTIPAGRNGTFPPEKDPGCDDDHAAE